MALPRMLLLCAVLALALMLISSAFFGPTSTTAPLSTKPARYAAPAATAAGSTLGALGRHAKRLAGRVASPPFVSSPPPSNAEAARAMTSGATATAAQTSATASGGLSVGSRLSGGSAARLDGSLDAALALASPAGPDFVLLTFSNLALADHVRNLFFRHPPFSPYVAPRFPHMSGMNPFFFVCTHLQP